MDLIIQLVKYGGVGVVSTGIHILAASAFVYLLFDSLVLSNIAGFLITFVFSYFAQSLLVFKTMISRGNAFRFFFVQVVALGLALSFSALLIDLNSYLRILTTACLLPGVAFVIHRTWTFIDR